MANERLQGLLGGQDPLFNIGMGILANNYGNYGAFGPALGRGFQQGVQQTQAARQAQQDQQAQEMQMDQIRRSIAAKQEQDRLEREQAEYRSQFITTLPQEQQSAARAFPQISQKLIEQQFAPSEIKAYKPGDVLYQGGKQIAAIPESAQTKLPSAVQEYQFAKEQGFPGSFLDFQVTQRRAGATNVNVSPKIDLKTGEGLAKEVGPMLSASKEAAEGAIQQVDIANRINAAIGSGKIIAGPGADARLKLLQIGNVLGANGRDDNETLTNTRTAIQGLSQFTLSGRSALKGQGQISDYEGKLLAKATSGDLSDLTIPELKVITKAAQRVSEALYSRHQRNMKIMRNKQELSGVSDFYEVGEMPATTQTAPSPTQKTIVKTGIYGGRKVVKYSDGTTAYAD